MINIATQISTTTFIADAITYIKELLRGGITDITGLTDPITRPSTQRYVMTRYPDRASTYPIVSVVDRGISTIQSGGMQSTVLVILNNLEVRVWARNVEEADEIAQSVLDLLRTNQFTAGGLRASNAFDFKFGPIQNVYETGIQGIKSKVIPISFFSVIGE